MKERIEFDGKSQAIDVIGVSKVGMLYLKIYWRDTDRHGDAQEHTRYVTNYMTKKEARDFSDMLRKVADDMGAKMSKQDQNNPIWNDNSIQFPRLLSEICACQDDLDISGLADSMDLEVEDIIELLDRSQSEWEKIKKKHCSLDCHGVEIEPYPPNRKQVYLGNRGCKCLYCLSKLIQCGPFSADSDSAWCEVSCGNCGREWTDIYTLTETRED